jgi:CRP-like cAMP-binding protein
MTASELRAVNCPANVDILRGLEPPEVDLILAAARPRRFAAKSVITHQGSPSDHLLLLWKGRARYFYQTPDGKKLILIWITPGQIFAGAALAPRPYAYLLSTEAVRDSVVLVWESSAIRALGQRFPRLLENAIHLALDYFAWYIAVHAALVSATAQERLANLLVALGPSIGQTVSDGLEIDVTNEELASSVNISPFTASRILSEWRKIGAIRKHRGKILLRSPKKLFLRVVDPKRTNRTS